MIAVTEATATKVGLEQPSAEWAKSFQHAVLTWFASQGRDFPWRHTSNPFHILIAEVLLRQTQAERVAKPYLELIGRYPDAYAMAQADVCELCEWFKPLGLVKRGDRLVRAAQILVNDYGGQVPNDLEALMALPGLGIYSARAVLCLSFGGRVPMVDEASGRILRRVLGKEPRGPAYSDSELLVAAERVTPEDTRSFNLGLIDIAAAYCHPRIPDCDGCPLVDSCVRGVRRNATSWGEQDGV